MTVFDLLWLEALKSRLLGSRNPFWQVLRSLWYVATEIPLTLAARRQLKHALQEAAAKPGATPTELEQPWVKWV
jgi:hypothetical protein